MISSWIGKVLVKTRARGQPLMQGRIVCVREVDDLVCMMPMPRIKKNGHVDNYVPSPKFLSAKDLAQQLSAGDGLQLLDFTSPAHWLWTDRQLREEIGDGSGKRRRYKLANWLQREQRAYEQIRPLVEGRTLEQVVFDGTLPQQLRERAEQLGRSQVPVRRALNAYLFGLGNRRALLPWYSRCGGPGRQRYCKAATGRPSIGAIRGEKRPFASTPPEVRHALALGWRRFKKRGVSMKQALARTLEAYLADAVLWDGPVCKVSLGPTALAVTPAMFKYWGTYDEGAPSARDINKGETLARREYLRRIGRMAGRFETVNGVAFIDSTSTDQTLVSAASTLKVLRAPWRTEVLGGCIDYIFGIHVGFEAPSATTALLAILCAAGDKVELCARFGHKIEPRDWYACAFNSFLMDNGEGKGALALRQIEDMESSASFGAAYDAINKAPVESGHNKRQKNVDHLMPGSTLGRRKSRGEPDRSQFARLRFDDYMHELIREVLHHNNQAYVDPPKIEMYEAIKERTRRGVLEWMVEHHYVSSAAVDLESLRVRCLPRLNASMHVDGLHLFNPARRDEALIKELVYRSEWLLSSGTLARAKNGAWRLEAHIDPSDIGHVWANLDGLRRLELSSNDHELKQLCLLDWLTISEDNRLAGYLARVHQIQNDVNKAASINAVIKAANARRRAEIEHLGRKPTKTELRVGRNLNTVIEAAAMNGVPRPLPAEAQPAPPAGGGSVISATPRVAASDPIDDLLEMAAALYEGR